MGNKWQTPGREEKGKTVSMFIYKLLLPAMIGDLLQPLTLIASAFWEIFIKLLIQPQLSIQRILQPALGIVQAPNKLMSQPKQNLTN